MARKTFISFTAIITIGVIGLVGCGPSSGTAGTTANTGSPAAIGGQNARGGIGGQHNAAPPTAGGTSKGAAGGSVAGGGGWVLSAPNSIFGFPRIQPNPATLDKIRSAITSGGTAVGVSGPQVIGVYDDSTHDVYLILAGYNGTGFDPNKLTTAYSVPPLSVGNAAGVRVTRIYSLTDPGPHGGTAGCLFDDDLSPMGGAENTSCEWMTSTTWGNIVYYPKPDHLKLVVGVTSEVMGKVMRDLRDQVEHRS